MSHHLIHPLGPHASSMQVEVLLWFAEGHDVLWIPIVEVGDEPDAIVRAQAEAATLGHAPIADLIQSRFIDTLLGCVVGLVGGVCLHSARFRDVVGGPLRRLIPRRPQS